jgi:hypothetical protein
LLEVGLDSDEEFDETVPLIFDGTGYRWTVEVSSGLCTDALGNSHGELFATFDYTLIPTAAEIRDGRYVVTEADLETTLVGGAVEPIAPECGPYSYAIDKVETATRLPG